MTGRTSVTKSDIGAFICGVLCLVRGIWFIVDFFRFLPPNANWYYVPHIILCLVGLILTGVRFYRKRKRLVFKEYEWIPLVVSIAYSFFLIGLAYLLPWDLDL